MRFMAASWKARPVLQPYGGNVGSRRQPVLLAAVAVAAALYGAAYTFFFPFRILELTIPLLVITLLVVWVLPESLTAPTRLLSGLFFSFFVLMTVWPDYIALSLPGLPWITIRRIIAIPLLVTLLVCLSTSSRFRSELKSVLSAAPMIPKLLVAFALIQLASIALSRDPALSLDKFIVAQLYWTLPFFVGCYLLRKPGNVAFWAALLCLTLLPLGLIGLWEWTISRVPWAGRIPSFLVVEDESVLRILSGASRAATGIYRVQSTFTTSLGFAEYMALTVPFLVHYVFGPFRLAVRIAALASIPAVFLLIVVTDSRLGMVGFLLSFLLYLPIFAALRWKRRKESLFAPATLLAYPMIFAAFITATFFVGRLRRMVWGGGEHQFSTDAREAQYDAGLEILTRNPIGHGIGMGAETLGFRNLAGVLTIDTYYVLIALEYGVMGFLAYYGMFLAAIYKGGRALLEAHEDTPEHLYLSPLLIAVGNFIVIKSIFSQESNHPLVFMMLAMVLALIWRIRRHQEEMPASAAA
jgi:hypothetical protein